MRRPEVDPRASWCTAGIDTDRRRAFLVKVWEIIAK